MFYKINIAYYVQQKLLVALFEIHTLLKKIKGTFWHILYWTLSLKKGCQGCAKLIASKVNCFLNITDLSEVQLCMSSNSWTWECPHTKDGADHVP